MSNHLSNLPPADELAALQAKLEPLKAREEELKALLIRDPSSRRGNQWLAEIVETTQHRISSQTLRELYPEAADASTFPVKYVKVKLSGIDPETGEIIPARKFKALTQEATNGR